MAPQNTLGARKASPTMMGVLGMKSGRRRWSAVQISSTSPTSTEPRPTVTIKTEIGGSPSKGRIMVRSITAPSRPEPSTAAGIASHSGNAKVAAKVKNKYAPTISSSPMAMLTTRVALYTITKASAASAYSPPPDKPVRQISNR